MITQSLHYSLSCDACGLGYGEIGNIENVAGVLKGSGWAIIGNKHFCEYCKDAALEREKERNSEIELLNPDEMPETYGGRTKSGWIKTSERTPEVGRNWVFGRTPDGKIGMCRLSKSLGVWVDEQNQPIKEGVEYWNYLPVFP